MSFMIYGGDLQNPVASIPPQSRGGCPRFHRPLAANGNEASLMQPCWIV